MLSFTAPGFLWLLSAAIPLIALHFWRRRQPEQQVAGLFLWRRAQQHVAQRRQLIATILLLLQLLLLVIVTALLSGAQWGETKLTERLVIVDTSASMLATGPAGAPADRAPALVAELLQGATTSLVVQAGNTPTVGSSELQFGAARSDIAAAVRVGLAALPGAEVHVITDQEFTLLGEEQQAALGFIVHNLGNTTRENIGITALDVNEQALLVVLSSNRPVPTMAQVALHTSGSIDRVEQLVPANGSSGVQLFHGNSPGAWEVRIETGGGSLTADDVVYYLNEPVTVVTNDDAAVLNRLLNALPNVTHFFSANPSRVASDVRLVQQNTPLASATGSSVRFPAPGDEGEQYVIEAFVREHPLLRFADLANVAVHVPSTNTLSSGEGWEVLAQSASGVPLIQARARSNEWDVEFAFYPTESDFPLRTAFPTFFYNLITAQQLSVLKPLGTDGIYTPGVHGNFAYNVLSPEVTALGPELQVLTQHEILSAIRAQRGANFVPPATPEWPVWPLVLVLIILALEWSLYVQAWPRRQVGTVEG